MSASFCFVFVRSVPPARKVLLGNGARRGDLFRCFPLRTFFGPGLLFNFIHAPDRRQIGKNKLQQIPFRPAVSPFAEADRHLADREIFLPAAQAYQNLFHNIKITAFQLQYMRKLSETSLASRWKSTRYTMFTRYDIKIKIPLLSVSPPSA